MWPLDELWWAARIAAASRQRRQTPSPTLTTMAAATPSPRRPEPSIATEASTGSTQGSMPSSARAAIPSLQAELARAVPSVDARVDRIAAVGLLEGIRDALGAEANEVHDEVVYLTLCELTADVMEVIDALR